MLNRYLTDLDDFRNIHRGNKILSDLFSGGIRSIRQICNSPSAAKGAYRFLQNDNVSEDDIIANMVSNCKSASAGKYIVCIQDTTEINLSMHRNRIKHDEYVGTTDAKGTKGLGFFLHPSLVLDAFSGVPYGYSAIKIWNRSLDSKLHEQRDYKKVPYEQRESYKWLECSSTTKMNVSDTVCAMIIIQDREGDIYEQYARIPDSKTDLLVRAGKDRLMTNGSKMFGYVSSQPLMGTYSIHIEGKGGRKNRVAKVDIRCISVEIPVTKNSTKGIKKTTTLNLIEAKEADNKGNEGIHWRLLTTLPINGQFELARHCVEWYSWRWTIEEIFRTLKKGGFDIEGSELEYGSSIRKLSLMILETIIKIFLMRIAYNQPEEEIDAQACFNQEEQEFLEAQINVLEGKTTKLKNPFHAPDLKRYVWAVARLGGWKGYESERRPGVKTLTIGYAKFKQAMEGWEIARNVSTR